MSINWFTFFAQIVNFLIVLYLLKRFLYEPIVKVMAEREAQITERFEEAEEMAEEARAEAESYRSERAELENRRNVLIEEAVAAADAHRDSLIDAARAEVEEMQASWYASVEHEKDRFLQEVRAHMGDTVYLVARDALADLANAELEQAIVSTFLEKVRNRQTDEPASDSGNDEVIVVRSAFDLSSDQQEEIREALLDSASKGGDEASRNERSVAFSQSPDLICGIEAEFNSRRIAWNIRDYLDEYANQLNSTLVAEMQASTSPITAGEHGVAAGGILPG